MAEKSKKIAVLGAGVCGLSTALRLQDADSSLDITIIADKFSPDTTSDGAAGIWSPTFLGQTPIETRKRWGKATYDYLTGILNSKEGNQFVSSCSGYVLSDQIMTNEFPYDDIVTRQIRLTSEDITKLNFPPDIKDGYFVTDVIFTSTPYLQRKLKEFQQKGGTVVKRRVFSFTEFVGKFDVVVNCSGLGAVELCKDKNLQSVRGQIIKVRAPWLKHFYMIIRHDEDAKTGRTCYIFPRPYDVVIGGTTQYGSYDTDVNEDDNEFIIDVTSKFEPTIKNAEIITTWVGLRPLRTVVRMEKEIMNLINTDNGSVQPLQVVHNYGHGGSGLSVFWGCAEEARDLALSFLNV